MKTINKLIGYESPSMEHLSIIMSSSILLNASGNTDLEPIDDEGEL